MGNRVHVADTSYLVGLLEPRHSFEVATPDATYYMFADTEKEKDEWIGQIGRYVEQRKSS